MAREYHNLRGVVRDITRALREGDYSEVRAFVDLLDDFADADAGFQAAEDASGEGADDGLGLPVQQEFPSMGGAATGHDSVQPPDLDLAARLGHAVERITQLESHEGRVPSDAAALATAVHGRRLVGGRRAKA